MPNTELLRYIPFLKNLLPHKEAISIRRLPVDIWVEEIFIYLTVEDVICLRRVNKTLFLITHEPVIWKRFLLRLPIPPPPLRPTLRWSLDLTSFQIEQLVTKAIIADDNWRRLTPRFAYSHVELAFNEVLELKLLPGGQYMVASVKDKSSRRFYICVYCLDHPDRHFPPLARTPVPTRAYNIQARFLPWKDRRPGIMILYCLRTPLDDKPRRYNLAELNYNPEIDVPFPVKHNCICTFVDMESLEVLSDPSISRTSDAFRARAAALPKPFQFVIDLVSNSPIEFPSLLQYRGRPFACIVQRPNEIVLLDLLTSRTSSIKCERIPTYDEEHKIRAVRVLPRQDQVLIIRTFRLRKWNGNLIEGVDKHTVEIHNLPRPGQLGVSSTFEEYRLLEDAMNVAEFHISDFYEPIKGRDHPDLYDPNARPDPITIYACLEDLGGMVQYSVLPLQAYDGHWFYNLEFCPKVEQTVQDPDHHMRILPGLHRALVYTVPVGDRSDRPKIMSLGRYHNPDWNLWYEGYPHGPFPQGDLSVVRQRYRQPEDLYWKIQCHSNVFKQISEAGCNAITWDESTGRVCMAMQKNMNFLILDVKRVMTPDDRFAQWRRLQAMTAGPDTLW
ncbi:hypothetical protein EV361DRAFT_989445 [Lentinula raphanica]|uniref:F-box domain-containing protein n=1 Tax=Lentinula raphanica TaxID=153919 RepID=A0AA38P433_9AGAR|nr:hypothetical protein F5880DRAFT_1607789 [Lentinula raphanica]KAJ3835795.1 hypothetical protein F5878DRAFT_626975 [Lentinula raphanica]KAJ3971527.1 hypothetical protein EV361DRAFT_989445 [Lentinula raphanica]